VKISEKIKILSLQAKYDISSPYGVYYAYLQGGKKISLFKILLTNICEKDCYYCGNSSLLDIPRKSFNPEELAKIFMEYYNRGYVEGLFLSSGIAKNSLFTMRRMIDTVEILRNRYKYKGYIHLKILPGADLGSIEKAIQLSDRVSVNIEAPNPWRLKKISSMKLYYEEILSIMNHIKIILKKNPGLLPSGYTTQFVVGASNESDKEILVSVDRLYKEFNIKRPYFSPFNPIPKTPLENLIQVPVTRAHRLYQADWLLRNYGFNIKDLIFEGGNLPVSLDPKLLWARANPQLFPIDINKASYHELILIPGIGPLSAKKIIKFRREKKFKDTSDLKKAGLPIKRALSFIKL
jgi:putative DNA modification/repair radical SAM protein